MKKIFIILGSIFLIAFAFIIIAPKNYFASYKQSESLSLSTSTNKTLSVQTEARSNKETNSSIGKSIISNDGKYIARMVPIEDSSDFEILIAGTGSGAGSGQKTMYFDHNKNKAFDGYKPDHWLNHTLYVLNSGTEASPSPIALFDIDAGTTKTISIPHARLGGEFVFSPDSKKIAYTDHPWLGDDIGLSTWTSDPTNRFNLYVFDLDKQTETTIGTIPANSSIKSFDVTWIDSKSIQYNDPITGNKTTKVIN